MSGPRTTYEASFKLSLLGHVGPDPSRHFGTVTDRDHLARWIASRPSSAMGRGPPPRRTQLLHTRTAVGNNTQLSVKTDPCRRRTHEPPRPRREREIAASPINLANWLPGSFPCSPEDHRSSSVFSSPPHWICFLQWSRSASPADRDLSQAHSSDAHPCGPPLQSECNPLLHASPVPGGLDVTAYRARRFSGKDWDRHRAPCPIRAILAAQGEKMAADKT